jgi:hypothetical protein
VASAGVLGETLCQQLETWRTAPVLPRLRSYLWLTGKSEAWQASTICKRRTLGPSQSFTATRSNRFTTSSGCGMRRMLTSAAGRPMRRASDMQ